MLALALPLFLAGPSSAAPPSLLVIGDSLAVVTEYQLGELLVGWRVRQRSAFGMELRTGMRWLRDEPRPPRVLAFSLFTNDPPRDTDRLAQAVTGTLRRFPGCHVWATLARAGPEGNEFAEANRRLRRLARAHPRRLVVVDWARTVGAAPALMSADGTHPTEVGAWVRAWLFAEAARRCLRRDTGRPMLRNG